MFYHILGSIHIQVVEIKALLEHALYRTCAPKGMRIRQSDKFSAGILESIIIAFSVLPRKSIQSIIIDCRRIRSLFYPHHAPCLIRVFAGHIQVQHRYDLFFFCLMAVHIAGGHLHFVAPHECQRSLRSLQSSVIDHLFHLGGYAKKSSYSCSIVVGAWLLNMSAQEYSFLRFSGTLDFCKSYRLSLASVVVVIHCISVAYTHTLYGYRLAGFFKQLL